MTTRYVVTYSWGFFHREMQRTSLLASSAGTGASVSLPPRVPALLKLLPGSRGCVEQRSVASDHRLTKWAEKPALADVLGVLRHGDLRNAELGCPRLCVRRICVERRPGTGGAHPGQIDRRHAATECCHRQRCCTAVVVKFRHSGRAW
jgi:hypothetical protein